MVRSVNEGAKWLSRHAFTGGAEGSKHGKQLCFLWGILATLGFSILGEGGHDAASLWMLLQLIGIVLSAIVLRPLIKVMDEYSLANFSKYLLHWSVLFISSTLLALNQFANTLSVSQLLNLSILLCSVSLMTGGLYLDRRFLPAGLVLVLCYLYALLGGPLSGIVSGASTAGLLFWLGCATNEPSQ